MNLILSGKQLLFFLAITSAVIISGCFPLTNAYKNKHTPEASLSWYVYSSDSDAETNVPKKEYQKRIERHLAIHPEISKEIAQKMRNCRVSMGMTEEEVLAMVEPDYVLKGHNKEEKIFKYSNVGKMGPGKVFGEGTKIWVTLTNGIVTDITEVDLVIGY